MVVVLLCVGALYQWLSVRGERGLYPAPGTLVDHLRGQSPAAEASRSIAQLYTVERMAAVCAMASGLHASVVELNAAPALRADLPLSVLTAGSSDGLIPPGLSWLRAKADAFRGDFVQKQQQFAARSTHGTWKLVKDSGHLIAGSQPHIVAEAVLDLIARHRAHKTSHEVLSFM